MQKRLREYISDLLPHSQDHRANYMNFAVHISHDKLRTIFSMTDVVHGAGLACVIASFRIGW